VISRAPGLKLVVQTLLSSLRPIGNIVLICCTFFIIFGILGVQVRVHVCFSPLLQQLHCYCYNRWCCYWYNYYWCFLFSRLTFGKSFQASSDATPTFMDSWKRFFLQNECFFFLWRQCTEKSFLRSAAKIGMIHPNHSHYVMSLRSQTKCVFTTKFSFG